MKFFLLTLDAPVNPKLCFILQNSDFRGIWDDFHKIFNVICIRA
ncbi:hypothetical protein SAMN05216283_102278 [Sunxiuqinia elliptica]|uniref:Uncharacterized protein n=1 Tax=Sunxiuqinia elliptica TaxID=655355 RepID=A0A1I2EXP2_9BACT|nr:hypothetical protein SAMN05216283_102278 [Sunxiuqinia elliptica]